MREVFIGIIIFCVFMYVKNSFTKPSTPITQNNTQQSTNNLNEALSLTPTSFSYQKPTPTEYIYRAPTTYEYPTNIPTIYVAPTAYIPQNKSCYRSGSYTYCSDGSSYLTNGDYTTINGGSNGSSGSCIKNGVYVSCSDESYGTQNGNYSTSYGNNGQMTTCIRNGSWVNCSDGSSTYSP